ncbi:MAG: hypothetical protein WCX85_01035 [Bacilli bacterium]|jgi:hypothetical protein|nr:hypothetical protein [Bacilli bacterium]
MNNKKTKLNTLFAVVFFGAVWGLLEATMGYILHWLPGMWSGLVMFPIGSALMYWAYQNTGRRSTILYVGLLAAAIKAINFAFPIHWEGLMRVYTPMISIILESITVFAVSYIFEKKTSPAKQTFIHLGAIVLAIVSWRTLFLANQGIQSAISGNLAAQLSSFEASASFIFVNGAYELLVFAMIYGVYRLVQGLLSMKKTDLKTPNWLMYVLSPLTLVFAVLAVVIPNLL